MINTQKPPVLRNPKLQQAFNEDGFVKFSMFTPIQVARLKEYYRQTSQQHETVIDRKKFHATNDTDNAALIADADAFIKSIMLEELDKHFYNYSTIAANYLVKQPHEASDLSPHQDLRFVDESKFYSLNVWAATEDTTPQNGCLRFLKGSHHWVDTIRPLPTYPWKYRDVVNLIPPYFTDVPTQAGEVIVLNHACIHASYPNLSGRTRVAAILALIPKDAEIYNYFLPDGNPENLVEQYAMTLEDFVNLKGGQRPQKAPLVNKFQADFSSVQPEQFYTCLGLPQPKQKQLKKSLYDSFREGISTIFK